jgi:hypothetical protein
MALKPASRPRHDSHDVQLATWDLVRAMHRRLEPDSPEAKYLADRLRRESPGGERLPADPIVGSWNLGSRGKLNAANCRVWTRRIRMLEMINRSVERLLAEETQDAAIELAGACPLPASDVKRSLPAWWDGACDFSLLYGVYRHGFGNFNAVRSDPWTAAVATEAAREKGGAAAVAELRESIEAIDECQKLYAQAREEHGARISEQGARAARKGPDGGSKGETKEEEEEEEEAKEGSAEEDGDDGDGDDEGEGDDDDAGNNVPAVGGDKSELVAAKERVERIHEGENAWPRTEDLTDRVRRVAKELGAPNALKPSDPPWVQAMLGHPRRVPKPPMSLAERAARDQKRGESGGDGKRQGGIRRRDDARGLGRPREKRRRRERYLAALRGPRKVRRGRGKKPRGGRAGSVDGGGAEGEGDIQPREEGRGEGADGSRFAEARR